MVQRENVKTNKVKYSAHSGTRGFRRSGSPTQQLYIKRRLNNFMTTIKEETGFNCCKRLEIRKNFIMMGVERGGDPRVGIMQVLQFPILPSDLSSFVTLSVNQTRMCSLSKL